MLEKYDVTISGAGPAGSLLGFLLAGEGIKTLIIEKEVFPRYKVCAGGIQFRALNLIPFDLGHIIERKISTLFFTNKNKGLFYRTYHQPVIFTVRREIFDDFLLSKARDAGCDVVTGQRVRDYSVENRGVGIITDKHDYFSKILVAADGVKGKVHKILTLGSDYHKIVGYESSAAISQYHPVPDMPEDWYKSGIRLDFFGAGKGYYWIFPKGKELSCGTGGPYQNAVMLKKYYKGVTEGELKGSRKGLLAALIPVRKDNTPFMSERVIAIGDAACLADGFTGEGIYNAIRSSLIASRSIKKALKENSFSFTDYAELMEKEIFKDIRISLKFAKSFYSRPFLYYNLLRFNKRFFDLSCKVLRGEVRYSDVGKKLKFIRN